MNINRLFSLLICLVTFVGINAQTQLPVMSINGNDFYYYKLSDKESVHGVSQKTGLPADVIAEYNTWASNGLEKQFLLLVPVNYKSMAAPQSSQKFQPQQQVGYTLAAGDNIYSVAKRFNASVEGILSSNISLAPSDYKPGATVRVTPQSAMPFAYDAAVTRFKTHDIKKDESFYSIANQYGTTTSTLKQLNPSVDKLKKGKKIIVPFTTVVRTTGNVATMSVNDLERHYASHINGIYNTLVEEHRNKECNVGIILPFQLHKSDAPKQAYLYTDYLKGFMLALDSLGNKASRKINVKVYDTQHNLNVTDSLLALPEMRNLDFIIAPGEPKQLERVNAFGQANGINVLNSFTTKNDDYKSNPHSLLVNTPTPLLVANLTQWMTTRFADCDAIFLEDVANEASEMFGLIKQNLNSAGVHCSTIKVDGDLSFDVLSRKLNPATNYVIIPSNGNKNLLKKIIPALKQAKQERFDCDFNLIAYPEHVLYLKDYQNDLMVIDTYMFSRFFNSKGFRTRNVENSYAKWYGGTMLESYPHMGLLGFDTGCYIIESMGNAHDINETTDLYKGIQTGFKFSRIDGCEGLVNQAITLVHFSPDKKIESFIVLDK